MKWGIVFLVLFEFTALEGLKFAIKNPTILVTCWYPKGSIGKLEVVDSAKYKVVYKLLTKSPLIDICKYTGQLKLMVYLDKTNTAKLNNKRFKIKARSTTYHHSLNAYTTVSFKVLPCHDGDKFVTKSIEAVKTRVKGTQVRKGKGKYSRSKAVNLLILDTKIPSDAEAKQISMAERKFEMAIESIKNHIIKQETRGNVYAFLRIKQLLSRKAFKKLENAFPPDKSTNHIACSAKLNFRTIDGTCNNLRNPNWGAASTPFKRIIPAAYYDSDHLNEPIDFSHNQPNPPDLPSPQKISRYFINDEIAAKVSPVVTHAVMQFGQFLDHDMDLSGESEGDSSCCDSCDKPGSECVAPCFPIPALPKSKRPCIPFIRSAAVYPRYNGKRAREQINDITSFIDGSQIYGSSDKRAKELRDMKSNQGLLRVSKGNLLPLDTSEDRLTCEQKCFVAGDVRANEQQGLTAFQTLFVREHNRIAKKLKKINNNWAGERIYQETRKIVGAVLQKIVYDDYLPLILGPNAIPRYTRYKNTVDPSVTNEFATAAYRFGHSTIRSEFDLLNPNFDPKVPAAVKLRFLFFNNTIVNTLGIEPILLGLVGNVSQKVDRNFSPEITRHLFERPGSRGLDLASLNIQRSRDHGLPGYNHYRNFCGLGNAKTFDCTKREIKSPENRKILKSLYNDNPNLVEPWVAGLAEVPVRGGTVGPTFACIIREQFRRTRDGDRFFFRNKGVFTNYQVKEIRKTSLSRIYCDNVEKIVSIQKNAFKTPTNWNRRTVCSLIPGINLSAWKDSKLHK